MEIKIFTDYIGVLASLYKLTPREEEVLRLLIIEQQKIDEVSSKIDYPINLTSKSVEDKIRSEMDVESDYHIKPYILRLKQKKIIVYVKGVYRLDSKFTSPTKEIKVLCSL